ncbi:MAG TPA: MFS transporter [Dehalococcoidia bacterium]|nr:MFS transporter [Dehalococcoidia bacterium]
MWGGWILERSTARKGIFYGWFVLAAGFFVLFMATGARNGFGVFIVPLTEEFGWSRGALSFAIAVGWGVNGLSQPFIGRLYDRFGGRAVISISLLILGVSTILLNRTTNLWFLIAVYGLIMSTASSGASLVTIHAVLAKWFYRRRGLVISISTAGGSAGSMIMAPFTTYMILWAGWRVSWVVLGGFILVLALPLAFFFIRDNPSKMGETPDGDDRPRDQAPGVTYDYPQAPLEREKWQESFSTPPIWQMTAAYFICGVTTAIISAHYVPFAIDRGASPEMAAFAFGLMTGLNVVGVITVGILSDIFGRKYLLGIIYATRGLAYAMLILAPGMIGIWGFAVIAGFSWVATASLTSTLTADIYGLRNLGTLGGVSTLSHQVGGALSVLMGGVLYDVFGSYDVPFSIAGSLLLFASIFAFSIQEKQYSSRYQTGLARPASASAGDSD